MRRIFRWAVIAALPMVVRAVQKRFSSRKEDDTY